MLRKMVAALFVTVLLCGAASAEDVDEIIAKYIEARGGMETLKSVNSIVYYGKMFQGGMEVPGKFLQKRPNKVRIEIDIQGQTIIQAFDGETGWYIMPLQGNLDPQKMTAEDLKDMENEADIDGALVDYKEKGHTVELIGEEEMEGSPAYKLKLTKKDGDISYIYLDAEYYLELKQTDIRTSEATETEIEIDSYFSDYKDVEGMMIAYAFDVKVGGQSQGQRAIDSVQVNVEIPDSLFVMPEIPEKEEPKEKVVEEKKAKDTSKEKKK